MISWVRAAVDNIRDYLEGIVAIEKDSFLSPWSRDAFLEEINNPVSRLWLLQVDSALAGYICYWTYCNETQLLDIAVDPGRRHAGLGRLLMNKMLVEAKTDGTEAVWLEVRPSNQTARNLYQALGFKEVGRRPGYYRDTYEEAIVMRLTLAENDRDLEKKNDQEPPQTADD